MLEEEIMEFANSIGILKCGFTPNSFVALFPYYVKGENGNISMYARGRDYHIVIREKLEKISEFMAEKGIKCLKIQVDIGEPNDRKTAYEAGLGFYGRNGMLICEELGSYFFIGYVLTDQKFRSGKPLEKTCLMCGACEKSCIGGAIGDKFCAEKCVSGISQRKGELSETEEKMIVKTGLCWGCDVCLSVCPHNKNLKTTAIPEFLENRIINLNLSDVKDISNRNFIKKYKDYAFTWRGKTVIERNLKLLGEKDE